jgi:hypothetical protein
VRESASSLAAAPPARPLSKRSARRRRRRRRRSWTRSLLPRTLALAARVTLALTSVPDRIRSDPTQGPTKDPFWLR